MAARARWMEAGPFGIPAGRLRARVLHAHRTAGGFRQHRGVHGGVVGVAAAVGAGADHPDHVDLVGRDAERAGDPVLHEMRLLRAGPAGDVAVLDLDQRAGRAHAGVRLERPLVLGLDHARGGLEDLVDVAGFLAADLALAHGGLADVIVERGLVGERGLGVRPFDLELLRRLDRVPFLVGDDPEEALLPHHLGARDVLDRAVVDLHRHAAGDRRTDHAAVRHARHLDVGAEVLLRVDLGRDVLAGDRLADDLVVLRVLRLRLAGSIERIAHLLVPVELDVEVAPADQLGIGRLLRRIGLGVHDAVADGERLRRQAELGGRHLDEHAPRLGGGHAHLLAAVLDAGRARGAALVHAGGGVAHDHGHGLERHVELLRHDLADGDEQALAHVHLAEEGGDGAVGIDGDVGGELVGSERRLRPLRQGTLREGLADAEYGVEPDRRADRDHQRAAGLEQRTAGELRGFFVSGHRRLPQPIISDARLTARMMPICVPQRHLRPVSASLISASVGFFF